MAVPTRTDEILLSNFHENLLKGFVSDQNVYAKAKLFRNDATCVPVEVEEPRIYSRNFYYSDPTDYDKWIEDYTEFFQFNNWFSFFTDKKCFPSINTYANILNKENNVLIENYGFDYRTPVRMLIVQYIMPKTHVLITKANDPCRINLEAISQLNSIKNVLDANRFIDMFGLSYPEAEYSLAPFHTLEIYSTSNRRTFEQLVEIGFDLLENLKLDKNGDIKFINKDFKLKKHKDYVICLNTLKFRLGPQENWSREQNVDFNLRIFERKNVKWKLVCEILETLFPNEITNKLGLNILKMVSKLRCFNFKLKNQYILEFININRNNSYFDVVRYWDEVIFANVVAFFIKRQKDYEPESALNILYDETLDLFKNSVVENLKRIELYMRTNMFFLDSTQSIKKFLRKYKNFRNLVIFHDQNLIFQNAFNKFSMICDNLEKFNLLPYALETNMVLIDYNLYKNDNSVEIPEKKLHKMDFFEKNIHFSFEWRNIERFLLKKYPKNFTFCQLLGMFNFRNLKFNSKYEALEKLDLSFNYIISIDGNNFNDKRIRKTLKVLSLNNNWIVNLEPSSFEFLASLNWLNLSYNFLKNFQINGNSSLKYLNLSNNNLVTIELNDMLINLETLDLSSNLLKEIDSLVLNNLQKLKVLKLEYNQIEAVDERSFKSLSNLEILRLKHNKISILKEDTFLRLKNLKILDLSYNKITMLGPKLFRELNELTHLYMQQNSLISLEKEIFYNNSSLKVLFLQANKISFLEKETFKNLINLKVLFLYENLLSKEYNYDEIKKQLAQLKYFCYLHENTKLKNLFLLDKIKSYYE